MRHVARDGQADHHFSRAGEKRTVPQKYVPFVFCASCSCLVFYSSLKHDTDTKFSTKHDRTKGFSNITKFLSQITIAIALLCQQFNVEYGQIISGLETELWYNTLYLVYFTITEQRLNIKI